MLEIEKKSRRLTANFANLTNEKPQKTQETQKVTGAETLGMGES